MTPLRYVILVVFILVGLFTLFPSPYFDSITEPPATDQPAFDPHYLP